MRRTKGPLRRLRGKAILTTTAPPASASPSALERAPLPIQDCGQAALSPEFDSPFVLLYRHCATGHLGGRRVKSRAQRRPRQLAAFGAGAGLARGYHGVSTDAAATNLRLLILSRPVAVGVAACPGRARFWPPPGLGIPRAGGLQAPGRAGGLAADRLGRLRCLLPRATPCPSLGLDDHLAPGHGTERPGGAWSLLMLLASPCCRQLKAMDRDHRQVRSGALREMGVVVSAMSDLCQLGHHVQCPPWSIVTMALAMSMAGPQAWCWIERCSRSSQPAAVSMAAQPALVLAEELGEPASCLDALRDLPEFSAWLAGASLGGHVTLRMAWLVTAVQFAGPGLMVISEVAVHHSGQAVSVARLPAWSAGDAWGTGVTVRGCMNACVRIAAAASQVGGTAWRC